MIDGRRNWRTPWKPLHQFVLLPPVERHLAWTTTCCKAGPGPPVFVVVEIFTTDGLKISARFAKLSGAFLAKLLKDININEIVSEKILSL